MKEEILKLMDPVLFIKTRDVTDFSIVPDIASRLISAMESENCSSLSANQIDIDYSIFVLDNRVFRDLGCPVGNDDFFVAVNPSVSMDFGEKLVEEGCVSYPGVTVKTLRSSFIVLECMNANGEEVNYNCSGMAAYAVQHEMDHLEGITVFTHSFPEKQREIILMQSR